MQTLTDLTLYAIGYFGVGVLIRDIPIGSSWVVELMFFGFGFILMLIIL